MQIRIEIKKEWFEKNKDKLIYVDKFDDLKVQYYAIEYQADNHERLIDENGSIKISTYDDNFNVAIIENKVEPETLINLSAIIVKYYNRAKTAFESLK